MIDFPITNLFDDSLCLLWLERHLHPDGFVCPQCGSSNRRRFRTQGFYDAYRCRACDGYYTLLSGTAFEGSRQRPATLVLLLRGITKGWGTRPNRSSDTSSGLPLTDRMLSLSE